MANLFLNFDPNLENSLPPLKCANGKFAPDCRDNFGARGTKLDLAGCKCVPQCPQGKTYYAASHFGKETCLTKAEYQKLKPTEFKAFTQMQQQAKAKQPLGSPTAANAVTGIEELISNPYVLIGGGVLIVLLLLVGGRR